MQFLDTDESSLLHSILAGHILIAHETARSDMLINCGLGSLLNTLSSLGDSTTLFVNELCARFSQVHTLAQPSGQPGLVALLDYLSLPPYDVDLSPEEKRFLERVKQKCLRWYASQIQKHLPVIDQPLIQGDRSNLLQLAARTPRIIDREQLIVNYDLYSLMAEFANQVNYGKAAAFTIGGDFTVLRGYIIERMRKNLMRRIPGSQKLLEISFDADDIAEGNDALVKKVISRYSCNTLPDLFNRFPKTHVILVIWCYAIPPKQMEIVASLFWKEVEGNVLPLLQTQNRCFVLILADVNISGRLYQIDKFTSLQIPSGFEMTDLLPWLRGTLENLEIEQSDIEHCLERLKDHHGDMSRTYHELEYIVSYLQVRYS